VSVVATDAGQNVLAPRWRPVAVLNGVLLAEGDELILGLGIEHLATAVAGKAQTHSAFLG
jgi:hypothetical protein